MQWQIGREGAVRHGARPIGMPEIVAFAAGRTDKKLALMQLEQFAEEIVGVTDVAGVINERGKGGIALDDILATEGLPHPVFRAGLTNAIDRSL